MKTFGPLPDPVIRDVSKQILQGLSHMHKHGFFHRDIKPENLLVRGCPPEEVFRSAKDKVSVFKNMEIKIADFGLAREIRSRPPYTDYVATRWYRAPELLLRSGPGQYSSAVDLWAVGCIIGELYAGKPLAAGATEANQFFKLCHLLGPPSSQEWSYGIRLVYNCGLVLPATTEKEDSLEYLCTGAPQEAFSLLRSLLSWNPARRPNATAALKHAYFTKKEGRQQTRAHQGSSHKHDSSASGSSKGYGLTHSRSFGEVSSGNKQRDRHSGHRQSNSVEGLDFGEAEIQGSHTSFSTSTLPLDGRHEQNVSARNHTNDENSRLPTEQVDTVMAEAFQLIGDESVGRSASNGPSISAAASSHSPSAYQDSDTLGGRQHSDFGDQKRYHTGQASSANSETNREATKYSTPTRLNTNVDRPLQSPKTPVSPYGGKSDASLDASAFMELLNELEQEKCQ